MTRRLLCELHGTQTEMNDEAKHTLMTSNVKRECLSTMTGKIT